MERTALAVDLGGTKLLVGEITSDGKVLSEKRFLSQLGHGAGQRAILEQITQVIDDYLAHDCKSSISGIGIGLVGRVDCDKGRWLEIEPSRCETIDVVSHITNRFHLPCAIDNDVRSALRAETRLGRGRYSKNMMYLNIGTGIGAGFMIDGKRVTGASYNAGEVGHQVVDVNSDVLCCCGRNGCVEAIACGSGLDSRARALRAEYPQTGLAFPYGERCSTIEIFDLAKRGDPLCTLLADEAASALAALIMNLTWVFDPDTIVLGGGVVSDGWLFEKIQRRLLPGPMRFVTNGVVLTELNPHYIALIGAGLSVL